MPANVDRRTFNATLLALGLGALLPATARAESVSGFLTTGYDKLRARHTVSRLGPDFAILWDLELPARGHGTDVRPGSDEGIVAARRPGSFACVFGLADGKLRRTLTPAPGRHFYGHGVFSADGKTLWMTENDFIGGRGVIGVYDAEAGYSRIGEFPSGGIGPHQLLALEGGRTLCVANGGILTHPDSGRKKLNIDTMHPSLAYIDSAKGTLSGQVFFDGARLQKLSIRHIASGDDGGVCIGCQDQIADGETPPLVYVHKRGEDRLRALAMPERMLGRFNGYCGSVVVDAASRTLAVSSPLGGLVGFWHLADGAWQGAVELVDGCGLAPTGGGVAISSGDGTLQNLDAGHRAQGAAQHTFRQWDNHMTALIT